MNIDNSESANLTKNTQELQKIAGSDSSDKVLAEYILNNTNEVNNIDIRLCNFSYIFKLCENNAVYLERFWEILKKNKPLEKYSFKDKQSETLKQNLEFYKFIDILKKPDSCLDNLDIIIKYYDARFHQDYIKLDELLKILPPEQQIQLLLNNHNKYQANEDLIGQDKDKIYKLFSLLTNNKEVKNIDKYYRDFIDKYSKEDILNICNDDKKIVFNFLLDGKIEPETAYNIIFNFFKERNMSDSVLKLHVYQNTAQTVEYINNIEEFNKDNTKSILSNFKPTDYKDIKNKKPKKIDQIGYIGKTREGLYQANFDLFFKSFINNVDITNYNSASRDTNSEKYNFVFDMLLGTKNEYMSLKLGHNYNAIHDLLKLSKLNLKVEDGEGEAVNFLNDNPEFKEQCYKNILKNIGYSAEQTKDNELFGSCLQKIPNKNHNLLAPLVKTYYELSDFDKKNNHFDINYKYFPILMKAGNVVFREKDIMGVINFYSDYLKNKDLIFSDIDNIDFLKGEQGTIEDNLENQNKFLDKLLHEVILPNKDCIKDDEKKQIFKDLYDNYISKKYYNKWRNITINGEIAHQPAIKAR